MKVYIFTLLNRLAPPMIISFVLKKMNGNCSLGSCLDMLEAYVRSY